MLRRHTEGVVIDSFYEVYIVGYKYRSDLRKSSPLGMHCFLWHPKKCISGADYHLTFFVIDFNSSSGGS